MVVGDSGSGKSSLIKAGVIPRFLGGALEDGSRDLPDDRAWVQVEVRPAFPSRDPFENLARVVYETARARGAPHADSDSMRQLARLGDPLRARDALRDASGRDATILLYVDQFEELLTLAMPERRASFIELLLKVAEGGDSSPVHVLMSMRWDYYNLCSQYPVFFEAVNRSKLSILPMGGEQLRRVIVEPLQLGGREAAQARQFAERVLTDVSGEPGDLALLQMALYQTWRGLRAHGNDLHLAYQAAGLVSGALANEAERVYGTVLSDNERREVEPLLLRLVRLGDTGGVTRRVVRSQELSEGRLALARKLATEDCGRLLQVRALEGGETVNVELTHEKLATQWPQYQSWLQNAAHDKRTHDELIAAARRWAEAPAGERSKHLLMGIDLEQAETLAGNRPAWLWEDERELVRQSAAARDEQIEKDRKTARLVRNWSRGAWVLAVGATVSAAMAWRSARLATERLADMNWANAAVHRDLLDLPVHARHYAAAVASTTRDPVRRQNAVFAVLFSTTGSYHLAAALSHASSVRGAVFDKDGARVLTWSSDGTARVWGNASELSLPVELLPLKVQVESGTRLTPTGDLEALSPAEWKRLKSDYESKLRALSPRLATPSAGK
jgi:hypothetical protein